MDDGLRRHGRRLRRSVRLPCQGLLRVPKDDKHQGTFNYLKDENTKRWCPSCFNLRLITYALQTYAHAYANSKALADHASTLIRR